MRRFHRWMGLGSAIIILLTVITGLLWAYAPYLYWESGYLEKKHPAPLASFSDVKLTHPEILTIAGSQLAPEPAISAITLRSEVGRAVYEVTGQKGGKEAVLLIDAMDGAVLSPIAPEFATAIARQYLAGEPPVHSATLLDSFKHRSGKVHEGVYSVRFQLPKNPEILLSASSGKIIEDQDDVRRFHFWIMRLHQLNFFGFKKTLTIIPGTAVLLLLATGIVLSRKKKRRAAKEPQPDRVEVAV